MNWESQSEVLKESRRINDFQWHANLAIKYRRKNAMVSQTLCLDANLNAYWILNTAVRIANELKNMKMIQNSFYRK